MSYGGYLTPHCKNCDHWRDSDWDFGCGRIDFEKCEHTRPINITQFKYLYDGPVRSFEKFLDERWVAVTIAPTEARARSNLKYRWKCENGYSPNLKIDLPGRLILIDGKENIFGN